MENSEIEISSFSYYWKFGSSTVISQMGLLSQCLLAGTDRYVQGCLDMEIHGAGSIPGPFPESQINFQLLLVLV